MGKASSLSSRTVARGSACYLMLASLFVAFAGKAEAQLTSNKYVIDLFTGPVLGPGRIVGMGGAHVAIASGIDGSIYNPVGYAERFEKEVNFAAFDVTGGIWLGGFFRNSDVENNGGSGLKGADTLQALLGMRLQFGPFGIGTTGIARRYSLKDEAGHVYSDVFVINSRTGIGYALFNGNLVLGAALSMVRFDLKERPTGKDLLTYRGNGVELGALFRPAFRRYRLGAAFRSHVSAQPERLRGVVETDGVRSVAGLVLPQGVHVPWELALGFAYQFGERRANVPWRNTRARAHDLRWQLLGASQTRSPETGGFPPSPSEVNRALHESDLEYREQERRFRRHQPRHYVLLAADVLLFGPAPNGQSVSAFVLQSPERSGQILAYGARVGVESEVWQDRMKVRAGSYLEPSRIAVKYYRVHGTFGMDVRLFDFWRWSARGTATVDLAPRYYNWGLALGLWW